MRACMASVLNILASLHVTKYLARIEAFDTVGVCAVQLMQDHIRLSGVHKLFQTHDAPWTLLFQHLILPIPRPDSTFPKFQALLTLPSSPHAYSLSKSGHLRLHHTPSLQKINHRNSQASTPSTFSHLGATACCMLANSWSLHVCSCVQ